MILEKRRLCMRKKTIKKITELLSRLSITELLAIYQALNKMDSIKSL